MMDLHIELKNEKEQIVAKTKCGKEYGNAILIDTKHAVTVKHCIRPAYENGQDIFLTVISCTDGKPKEIKAVIAPLFDEELDEWVMLELEQEVDERVMKQFAAVELTMFSSAATYGYDANYRAEACWTELKSVGGTQKNAEQIQDQIFQLPDNRESDFSGLSGSPIFRGEYIIGIVSQQKTENGRAIDIRGISVKSSRQFMEKYKIPIEKLQRDSMQEFDQPLTAEKFQTTRNSVIVADGADYQGILSGKYRDELNSISELRLKGDVSKAWDMLKKGIRELEQNPLADSRIKAEYLMKLAVWYLEDFHDTKKALKKYDAAMALHPTMDGSVFQALKQANEDIDNAEDILKPINSVQKLNVYMQICINSGNIDKAVEIYDTVAGIIEEDDVTYYLLSIIELLHRDYNNAEKYIDVALDRNYQVPIYHLLKATILYWKAIPEDMHLSNEIYPPLFSNGIVHLDMEEIALLKEASVLCRTAYTFSVSVKNEEQVAQILAIWINILSVEIDLNNDLMEPLQLLRKADPLNITVLLYSIQRDLDLDENITVETIEKRLKESKNKVGYVIVLIEFCIKKRNFVKAKQFLHEYKPVFNKIDYLEYWYEYVARLETDSIQLERYEGELDSETKLEFIQKKRLRCLFLEKKIDSIEELEKSLLEIYTDTHKRLDLMNVISFYRINMRWNEMAKYSKMLMEDFDDRYGCIYYIRALIQLEQYEQALDEISILLDQQMPHTYLELMYDRMFIMDRLGKYEEAIRAGEELVKEDATERAIIQLSTLYVRNGEPDRALGVLLEIEKEEQLTPEICQRISTLYLMNDSSKAWKYAQKAVILSKEDPNVMLWATDIANRSGHSEQAGEYYYKIARIPSSNVRLIYTLDEALEFMQQSRVQAEEMIHQYESGQLPAHLYVDSFRGNLTYGEFFYRQWNARKMAPIEFGAHRFQDEDLKLNGKIGLDYSSCILLHEIGVLDLLVQYVSEIYVSGEILGIIDTELRKIPVVQQDLLRERVDLLEYCIELGARAVKIQIPEGIANYNAQDQSTMMCKYTAMQNDALWITNERKQGIHAIDVVEALYRKNQITEDAYQDYHETQPEICEENVNQLQQSNLMTLLVDEDILMQWKKTNILEVICSNYSIIYLESMSENIQQEQQTIYEKEKICNQLKGLNDHLKNLRSSGKLKFYPIQDQKESLLYGNMLMTLFTGASRWNIPVCIDDRVMTSYSTMGGSAHIYNTFDIMRILYINRRITLEKYCNILQILYQANIQYVLPHKDYLLYALKMSTLEGDTLIESGMLSGIRKNVLSALSEQSHISMDILEHIRIPEREYYLLYLQREAGDIIQNIWQSSESIQKKCQISNWILWHYSQFAFGYSNIIDLNNQKRIQTILLAEFLVKGMLITLESDVKNYYHWMYQWMKTFFHINADMKEKTLTYTKELLIDFIQKGTYLEMNGYEQRMVQWKIAMAIHLMPVEYQKVILENRVLWDIYNKIYSVINIVLLSNNQIPAVQFASWEWEVLKLAENELIHKAFQGVDYSLKWLNQIPALQVLHICWEQKGEKREQGFYIERGKRLFHSDKMVRREEFKLIEPYLPPIECEKIYNDLMSGTGYDVTGKKILELLDLSVDYEYKRIDYGLRNSWLEDENGVKMLLPEKPDYFKQFFDWENDGLKLETMHSKVLAAVPICLEKRMEEDVTDNNNPIRELRKLAQILEDNPKGAVLKAIDIFSYLNGNKAIYGHLYMLLLKAIWQLFEKSDSYMKEKEENRIIWSYIWADEAMTCLSQWIKEEDVDLVKYISSLEENMGIHIDTDDFWESIEEHDVLSPVNMNLFKLCITGTFVLYDRYQNQIGADARPLLEYADQHLSIWMNSLTYYREAVLSHKGCNNVFGSIFVGNIFSVVKSLYVAVDANGVSIGKYFNTDSQIELILDTLLESEKLTESNIGYLFLLTRERRTDEEIQLIEEIITMHVLEKEVVTEPFSYKLLTNVVWNLSENFQEKYISSEYARFSKLMISNPQEWEIYYNLAIELYQIERAAAFVEFLNQCVNGWNTPVNLKFAELIAQLQLYLPYEYSDKLVRLRIQYELIDTQ